MADTVCCTILHTAALIPGYPQWLLPAAASLVQATEGGAEALYSRYLQQCLSLGADDPVLGAIRKLAIQLRVHLIGTSFASLLSSLLSASGGARHTLCSRSLSHRWRG